MNDAIAPLFGASAVRRDVLEWFFARPEAVAHPRELARRLGRSPQVVGRELARLEAAGVLTSENIGRTRRYRVDSESPIAADVKSLVAKTIGVEARLRSAIGGLRGVEEASIFGSYARGADRATSDIDVLIIGAIDRVLLSEALIRLEQDLGRDINVTTYTHRERDNLLKRGNSFLRDVFAGPRVLLFPPTSG